MLFTQQLYNKQSCLFLCTSRIACNTFSLIPSEASASLLREAETSGVSSFRTEKFGGEKRFRIFLVNAAKKKIVNKLYFF